MEPLQSIISQEQKSQDLHRSKFSKLVPFQVYRHYMCLLFLFFSILNNSLYCLVDNVFGVSVKYFHGIALPDVSHVLVPLRLLCHFLHELLPLQLEEET